MNEPGADAASLSLPQLDDVLRGLLQYLSTIAKPGATVTDESFKAALAASSKLANQGEVEAALHALASMPPTAWTAALSQASPAVRASLHAQILLLGEVLSGRVPVYAQTTTLLRLLLYRILPAISAMPEDDQYGTSEELLRHFKGLQFLSGVIQPTEEIPAVKDMAKKLKDAQSKEAFMTSELEGARGRMKQLGVSLSDKTAGPNKDEDAAVKVLIEKKRVAPAKYKTLSILFGVFALVLLLVAVALIVLYVTKTKGAKGPKAPAVPAVEADTIGRGTSGGFSQAVMGGGATKSVQGDSRYLMTADGDLW